MLQGVLWTARSLLFSANVTSIHHGFGEPTRSNESSRRPWRIAQVAPLHESVPPRLYGGTERVVSWLTEELVAMGHEVTLFASGNSETSAHLVPTGQRALRLDSRHPDPIAMHLLQLERVFQEAARFDVIHFHCDFLHYPLTRRTGIPSLTTLHGRLDVPGLSELYAEFTDIPLVSISDSQRKPLPSVNWRATVHHGLPLTFAALHPEPGEYLAVLGRVSPEKGVDRAIEIARRAGLPLRIAAKVDPVDQEYFDSVIHPRLSEPGIEYLGEIGESDKSEFLGRAYALLFPIDWPEPFGLVMIEAMACGTPVIAFDRGSVPEVLENGKTGYIVSNIDEAVSAVTCIPRLSRATCRAVFEERFSAARMARDYLAAYASLDRQPRRLGGSCEPALTT
jgi:glycosyltransferase involved in cell wall biosynthesis